MSTNFGCMYITHSALVRICYMFCSVLLWSNIREHVVCNWGRWTKQTVTQEYWSRNG